MTVANQNMMQLEQAVAAASQHHQRGNLQQAEIIYRQVLQHVPDHHFVLHNLGEIAYRCGKLDASLQLVDRAISLYAKDHTYHNTRAAILRSLSRFHEAKAAADRSIELNDHFAHAWSNLGIIYADLGDLPSSIAAFERAIAIDPQHANAHDGLGLSLLMAGDLQRGWQEQEWRWRKTCFEKRRYTDRPQWTGQDLKGKRLLLFFEQGFGDVFQFCRYVPLLTDRGAEVYIETAPPVRGLLATLRGVRRLVNPKGPCPPLDYVCPLMSVPLWFGTTLDTIPAQVPYLKPDPGKCALWELFFRGDRNLKVGIAWAGSAAHANDRNRSTTLAAFAPLAEIPGITFYSLQKGAPEAQLRTPPPGMKIINIADRLKTFDDTAGAVMHLDLIVSVDTSVVHLAGALNRPVWNLLAFCPDWRWLTNRSDTPWYPTMRLFRQPTVSDWTGLFVQVREALAEWAQKQRVAKGAS